MRSPDFFLTALTVAMAGPSTSPMALDLLSLYREAAAQDPAMAAFASGFVVGGAGSGSPRPKAAMDGLPPVFAAGANANFFDLYVRNPCRKHRPIGTICGQR